MSSILRYILLSLFGLLTFASNGHIYSVALNGTTNILNFIDLNLDTYIASVGPPLNTDFDTFGESAVFSNYTSTGGRAIYWTFMMDSYANFIAGFDVIEKDIVYILNCSSWPNGGPYFMSALFERPDKSLLAIGEYGSAAPTTQTLYSIVNPTSTTPTVTILGNVSCPGLGNYCSDCAYDVTRDILFQISGEEDQNDSGGLVTINVTTLQVLSSFNLQNHFAFSFWDPITMSVVGIELATDAQGNYMRNLTLISDPVIYNQYNATSHGAIGDGLYVTLEPGPKDFDPFTRRAFFMLANGPFGEFDVAVVNVDSIPPTNVENVGLCGFVGYCPQAFAYGS